MNLKTELRGGFILVRYPIKSSSLISVDNIRSNYKNSIPAKSVCNNKIYIIKI